MSNGHFSGDLLVCQTANVAATGTSWTERSAGGRFLVKGEGRVRVLSRG